MATKWFISFLLLFLIFLSGFSSVSASPPARIAAGIVTNVVSTVFKWLWSLRTPVRTEKAVSTRSLMKFEGGYTVETVFDGIKMGIEPYTVEASPTGELLILDSVNSNLYKISSPSSRYSRPKLIAGSPEGYTGHVDGKLREARMYQPKGITVDDSGNIYIADTLNMAIRKISDAGITTIAGGKWSNGGGHMDGPSEDAKFSDDFDVVYARSTCSLLVTDRGNQAIREIQLHDADCSYEHPVQHEEGEDNFLLGVAVLIASVFFGYMLALLKQRVQALFSTNRDSRAPQSMNHAIIAQSQRPLKSVRPPLIPVEDEDEYEKEDEGLFFSFGRLIINAGSSVFEIFTGLLFSGFTRKKPHHQNLRHFQQQLNRYPDHHIHGWPPIQDSYVIRDEDEAPKPYPLMNMESDDNNNNNNTQKQFRQSQAYYEGRDGEFHQHQGQISKQQQQQQQQPQNQRHVSSNAKTSHEKGSETSEIVFGAIQEQDGRRETMVIKAVDFSDPVYNQHNVRPRVNYMGYSSYKYS